MVKPQKRWLVSHPNSSKAFLAVSLWHYPHHLVSIIPWHLLHKGLLHKRTFFKISERIKITGKLAWESWLHGHEEPCLELQKPWHRAHWLVSLSPNIKLQAQWEEWMGQKSQHQSISGFTGFSTPALFLYQDQKLLILTYNVWINILAYFYFFGQLCTYFLYKDISNTPPFPMCPMLDFSYCKVWFHHICVSLQLNGQLLICLYF